MELDEAPKTTAVYAFTTCTAHGFTKEICLENLKTLCEAYSQVDMIAINADGYRGIRIFENVGAKSSNGVPLYQDYVNSLTFAYTRHWNCSIYTGLYEYLMDVSISDSNYTGTGDSQKRFPTAIYTSFDELQYAPDGVRDSNGVTDGIQYNCWDILVSYDRNGRYFSCGADYWGMENRYTLYEDGDPSYYRSNLILALMDPAGMWGEVTPSMENIPRDHLWDGETFDQLQHLNLYSHILGGDRANYVANNKNYRCDYTYSETFAALDVTTIIPVTLVDTISDNFVIAPTDPLSWSSVDTGGSDTIPAAATPPTPAPS